MQIPIGQYQNRALALRAGANGGRVRGWPSDTLHAVAPRMEPDGLDHRRLQAIAEFIGALPMDDGASPDGHRTVTARHVYGQNECTHYALDAGGDGLGYVEFDRMENGAVVGLRLTGYGIACWAFGQDAGMSAVARDNRVSAVQTVLTAAPVPPEARRHVTPAHVAGALARFVECLDPEQAWQDALDKPDGNGIDAPVEPNADAGTDAPEGDPEPVAPSVDDLEAAVTAARRRVTELTAETEQAKADLAAALDALRARYAEDFGLKP